MVVVCVMGLMMKSGLSGKAVQKGRRRQFSL